jgi:hypothetical protein
VVPTGWVEYTYLEQRQVIDRALGEPLATLTPLRGSGTRPRRAARGARRLTDNLPFIELRRLLHAARDDPDRIAHRLVDAASARSHQPGHVRAKIDDITAVAAQVRCAPPT